MIKLGTNYHLKGHEKDILQNFLFLSPQIRTEQEEEEPIEEISIREIFSALLDLHQRRFEVRGMLLTCAAVTPSQKVFCRPAQISRALVSLLNQAISSTRGSAQSRVCIDIRTYLDSIVVEAVISKGAGKIPEIADRVIYPFANTRQITQRSVPSLKISRLFEYLKGGQRVMRAMAFIHRFLLFVARALE